MKLPGYQNVHFHDYFKKISLDGQVLCVFCNDTINYASRGKKALHSIPVKCYGLAVVPTDWRP